MNGAEGVGGGTAVEHSHADRARVDPLLFTRTRGRCRVVEAHRRREDERRDFAHGELDGEVPCAVLRDMHIARDGWRYCHPRDVDSAVDAFERHYGVRTAGVRELEYGLLRHRGDTFDATAHFIVLDCLRHRGVGGDELWVVLFQPAAEVCVSREA